MSAKAKNITHLIENAVDSVIEELGDDVGGSFQRDGVALRSATHVCSSYKQNLFLIEIIDGCV